MQYQAGAPLPIGKHIEGVIEREETVVERVQIELASELQWFGTGITDVHRLAGIPNPETSRTPALSRPGTSILQ